jgi:hypothetical protein
LHDGKPASIPPLLLPEELLLPLLESLPLLPLDPLPVLDPMPLLDPVASLLEPASPAGAWRAPPPHATTRAVSPTH